MDTKVCVCACTQGGMHCILTQFSNAEYMYLGRILKLCKRTFQFLLCPSNGGKLQCRLAQVGTVCPHCCPCSQLSAHKPSTTLKFQHKHANGPLQSNIDLYTPKIPTDRKERQGGTIDSDFETLEKTVSPPPPTYPMLSHWNSQPLNRVNLFTFGKLEILNFYQESN